MEEEGHTRGSSLAGRGVVPGWRGIEWLWCDDEEGKVVLPRYLAGIYASSTRPPSPSRQHMDGMELLASGPPCPPLHELKRCIAYIGPTACFGEGGCLRMEPGDHIDGTCNGTQASSAWPSLHPDMLATRSSPSWLLLRLWIQPGGLLWIDACLHVVPVPQLGLG